MPNVILGLFARLFDLVVLDLGRQLRWSYLPPLMVYLAAGISGLTAIVGTFFIKEYLDLSAAFIAGLGFWIAIPWALKMPIGHLADIFWRWKFLMVFLGASLIASSLAIMYGLIVHTSAMSAIWPVGNWYIASALLAPIGYVIQDVVADAMTVEAVPLSDENGTAYDQDTLKSMHTTMQTLGRVSIIGGTVLVALLNVAMFSGVEDMSEADKVAVYARIYMLAFAIPAISVAGVVIAQISHLRRTRRLQARGLTASEVHEQLFQRAPTTPPNWWILGGSLVFVIFTLAMGLSGFWLAQEIIFIGSMCIILFLMNRLMRELPKEKRNALVGTAVIIFMFRAVPLPGAGATWWEIDVLKFDQHFLSILTVITATLTLAGMLLLRPLMATKSIAYIVVLLTIAAGLLSLPNIGLFYGLHNWTASWSGGIVDARFIAIFDTALESPLGQISMIPLLTWIAKNAPPHLKATFFAVMASFTNLALSASNLITKYMNKIFLVTREVTDPDTGALVVPADYSLLGWLLITVACITVVVPLITVMIIQKTRLQTTQ